MIDFERIIVVLNIFWLSLIIFSMLMGIINGKVSNLGHIIFTGLKSIFDTFITISLSLILWSGFLRVAVDSGLIDKLKRLLRPFLELIFDCKDQKAFDYMSINIISNIFGLGNAATPAGIKAIEQLDRINRSDAISDDMILFIILNTCSIQLIPTTIIALRASYHSKAPDIIVAPIIFVSIIGVLAGVLICKLFSRVWKR